MVIVKSKILKEAMNHVNHLLWSLDDLYYHTYEHSLEVMNRAMYLWKKEWLSEKDIEILWLAWIFHDTWFIVQYDNNELIWAKVAKNYLKSIKYSEKDIKLIEDIIVATQPSYQEPKNIYEEIIKDADMDNFWREDFFDKWSKVKKEIELIKNIKIKEPDWFHFSLDFLYKHTFFTTSAQKERLEQKKRNIKETEEIINKLKK